MKTNKIFISIFLLTFFVGVIIYFLTPTMENLVERKEIAEVKVVKEMPALEPKIKGEINLEILEENTDWKTENESKYKIRLQEIGEGFHGDQVEANTGEMWLGLFKGKNGFYLKNSKVKIRLVHDSVVDGYYEEEATQKTGKSVSVNSKHQPIYLLKNAEMLKEGKVKTLFGGNPNSDKFEEELDYLSLKIGFSKEFKLENEKYSIKVKKGINKKQEKIFALILENGSTSQVLHSLKYFGEDDSAGALYWVGDLDRDGKLDILTELYFHDNVSYRNLFLSSQAKDDKLVEKVAVYSTTGC